MSAKVQKGASKEDGAKEVNPYIPQFISKSPWYAGSSASQQQQQSQQNSLSEKAWYQRGVKGPAATKYRKGACTNCGAMTHSAKECTDRPRKIGARWSGKDIKPDEIIQEIGDLGYEGKRDRWNGYDSSMHTLLMETYDKVEMEKRRLKQQELLEKFKTEPDENNARFPSQNESKEKQEKSLVEKVSIEEEDEFISEDMDDEYKIKEGDNDAPMVGKDLKTRTTVRNLRIREDTAKYLRNLDLNSAPYDPKSRSMKENPTPHVPPDQAAFLGDNAARFTGDVLQFAEINRFAWEASERGQEINIQALPSQAELLQRQFKQKKDELKRQQQKLLLSKYGGQEHMQDIPKEIILSESDQYEEYTRSGKPLKGTIAAPAFAKSKWEEDVFINNHTSVWGSWWENGKWGYACCHSLIKNSWCTGRAGIEASQSVLQEELAKEGEAQASAAAGADAERLSKEVSAAVKQFRAPSSSTRARLPFEKDKQPELDEEKVKAAMRELDAMKDVEMDERKRKFNSFAADAAQLTPEQIEAYRRKRILREDPVAKFADKDAED